MRQLHLWPLGLLLSGFIFFGALINDASAKKIESLVVCDDVKDPPTLDPQREFTEKNHTIVQQIYDGLVRFNEAGKIEPALAVSWKRINPTVVQFELRKDVRFHNGEPFNAHSVKYSIDRYLDPKTGFPAYGFISPLKEAVVVGSHKVNIVTHFPDGLILNRLAGFIVMVPPRYVQKGGDHILQTRPVGTGAFKFSSWIEGEKIELVANQDYWEKDSPHIEKLIFRFMETDKQVRSLVNGNLNLVTEIPGTETFHVEQSGSAHVIKRPTLFTVAASFNINDGPLSHLEVRQALNYAINKKDLIRYDLLGNGQAVRSLVLSGHPGFNQLKSLNPYVFNLKKAKALLKKAGYKNGFKLRMLEVKAGRTANIIKAHLERLGIEVEVTSTTDAQISHDVKKKKWDIVLGSCPDPMYHPFFINSIFLYSKSPFSLNQDLKLDKLIEDLLIIEPVDAHEKRIIDLAKYVNENALSLFTYQRIKTYGISNGLVFNPYASGMSYFRSAHYQKRSQ